MAGNPKRVSNLPSRLRISWDASFRAPEKVRPNDRPNLRSVSLIAKIMTGTFARQRIAEMVSAMYWSGSVPLTTRRQASGCVASKKEMLERQCVRGSRMSNGIVPDWAPTMIRSGCFRSICSICCKALGFWTLIWRMVRPPWTTPAGSSGAPGRASDSRVARGATSRCRLS